MRKFWWMQQGPLRDANAEGGDGGGSGGTLSMESVKKMIDDQVNAAVNGAVKRLEASQAKVIGDITKQIGDLAETFKAVKPASEEGESKEKKGGDPAVNAELDKIRRDNEKLRRDMEAVQAENKKQAEAAERKDRELTISQAFSDVQFANAASRDLALAHVAARAKRDDTGELVVPGETGDVPVTHYVKTYLESVPNLLAPKPAGGAGSGKGTGGSRTPTLEGIKPGMSAEETAAYTKHMAALITGQSA